MKIGLTLQVFFWSKFILLYFDWYSQEFLGIRIFDASDIFNKNFKYLILLLHHQNPSSEPSLIDSIKFYVIFMICIRSSSNYVKIRFSDWCLIDIFDASFINNKCYQSMIKLGYEISWSLDLCDKYKLDPMIWFFDEIINPVHVMRGALEWYIGCTLSRLRILAFDAFT